MPPECIQDGMQDTSGMHERHIPDACERYLGNCTVCMVKCSVDIVNDSFQG